MATTPLTRPLYLLGKWLSNFAVLMAMITVLALAGIAIQFWKGENAQIDLLAYLAPFLFIVFPLMALVAALALFCGGPAPAPRAARRRRGRRS